MNKSCLNKNIKIFLNWVVGPLLFIWLTWSIIIQVRHQPNLNESLRYLQESAFGLKSRKFWIVIAMMFLNWGLEARKWQVLMNSLEKISFWRAFKAVLSGVSFALNTPNRIGEYGGRILYVSEGKRIQSAALTIAGSFSQLIITLFMGGLGVLFSKKGLIENGNPGESLSLILNVLMWAVFIAAIFCLLIYFRLAWIVRSFEKVPLVSRFVKQVTILETISVTILLRVLSLSFVRYVVFVVQYILLFDVMHVYMGWWQAFWLIGVLYLVLAVVPTIALLELGIRGKASILLFKLYSSNSVGIYATATGIWLVNLVVPALAGSLLIIGVKIFNEKR
ncbi:MAG: hypothetical protein C5B52_18665 [Bacteroidetes bacterium]|nr:MAG: hypothetical protein C5B52_18665 [Bacteroidota bacterium]